MRRVAGVLLALPVLAATACGGDDDGGGAADAATADVVDGEGDAPVAADAATDATPDAAEAIADAGPVTDADPGAPDASWNGPLLVPAGSFTMGCAVGDGNCSGDEYPRHMVSLSAYLIDRTEVTQKQYQQCLSAGACSEPHAHWEPALTPDEPVRDVTWTQAATYCAWRGARLPTEAEWERAARGPGDGIYPWGNSAPTCSLARYSGCGAGPAVVTSLPAGAGQGGMYDVAGNVWEWVGDWYASDYYGQSPATDPTGPATGFTRVARGGSYATMPHTLRASERVAVDPALPYDDIGFRCAQPMP
jgi:formylglycine-generating enzyme required for sulfatase activity